MKAVSASASRYAMIHQVLRDAIVNGTARHGLVLLEAPLAELFGTSRVPVRKALDLLHAEGLICRFNGRGYLINPEGLDLEPLLRAARRAVQLVLNGAPKSAALTLQTLIDGLFINAERYGPWHPNTTSFRHVFSTHCKLLMHEHVRLAA